MRVVSALLNGIHIKTFSSPSLSNPKLICGLPGSGYVGKLAIDFLIDKLNATRFADIYSNSFPPQVSIQSDGTVDLVKNSLYHCKTPNFDLILLTGDVQPVSAEGEYELAEEIINICKKLGVSQIITLAAYITGKFSDSPKVFGASTSTTINEFLLKKEIFGMNQGNITGMNGVIIGTAKKQLIDGVCLLGETSGYVVDAKASKSVLDSLCKLIGLTLDMSELEKRAQETEEIIKALQSQMARNGPEQQIGFTKSEGKNLGYIS